MATNVPQIQFTSTGLSVPTSAQVQAGVQADLAAIFGSTLNTQLSSPQGQLMTTMTQIIEDAYGQIASVINAVDPNASTGSYLDALGRIYGLSRVAATFTAVQATVTGLAGQTLPAGSLAADTAGNVYASTAAATFGTNGTASVAFQCQTAGAIVCGVGALSVIYKAVQGWDRVTNAVAGATGAPQETDQAFRIRQANSVAIVASGRVDSIYAALTNPTTTPGVTDAFVVDNPGGSPLVFGATNYTLAPHSVLASVTGGTDQAVAQTIWAKKDLGCAYNGNTTVTIYDTNYQPPQPFYPVTFLRPAATNVYFAVSIENSADLPSNYLTLIQNALLSAFVGGDGGPRARIGSEILASRFYAPVIAAGTGIHLLHMYVGLAASPTTDRVTMGVDQQPVLAAANVTVTLV